MTTTTDLPFDAPALGRTLRLIRDRAGLSQEDVAVRMSDKRPPGSTKVQRTTVYRWEKSGRIYFTDLMEILHVLGSATGDLDGIAQPVCTADERMMGLLLYLLGRIHEIQTPTLPGDRNGDGDSTATEIQRRLNQLDAQIDALRRLTRASA